MILIKHYYIDNRVGIASSRSKRDLRYENIKGLNVIHILEDDNGYPYILSECPSSFEYNRIFNLEGFEDLQNTPGVGIITYTGFTTFAKFGPNATKYAPGQVTKYDVTYTIDHDMSQYVSIEVVDQETWSGIITSHDNMQQSRRVALLNDIKSAILTRINNFVSYLISEGVIAAPSELTTETKNWRNQIINLGDSGFPRRLPLPPPETHGNVAFPAADYPQYQIRKDRVIRKIYRRWFEMYQLRKINDDIDSLDDVATESIEYYEVE